MKLHAAAFAILLASPAWAQDDAPVPPAVGTTRLHPVFIDKQQTAFVDIASLTRSGDTVDGWGLNVYAHPTEVTPGNTGDAHWTRFRMSCAARTAAVTWLLGRRYLSTTFKARMGGQSFAIQDRSGWDQTYYYICKSVPLFKGKAIVDESVAIGKARAEMRSKP